MTGDNFPTISFEISSGSTTKGSAENTVSISANPLAARCASSFSAECHQLPGAGNP